MKRLFLFVFTLIFPAIVFSIPAPPYVGLQWDNPTTDVQGNPINNLTTNTMYCGTTSGDKSNIYPFTAASSSLFTEFLPGDGTWYCVVTATAPDINGVPQESRYSNEIGPFTVTGGVSPAIAPGAPGNLRFL